MEMGLMGRCPFQARTVAGKKKKKLMRASKAALVIVVVFSLWPIAVENIQQAAAAGGQRGTSSE